MKMYFEKTTVLCTFLLFCSFNVFMHALRRGAWLSYCMGWCNLFNTTRCLKKTSQTFLAVTQESIVGFS